MIRGRNRLAEQTDCFRISQKIIPSEKGKFCRNFPFRRASGYWRNPRAVSQSGSLGISAANLKPFGMANLLSEFFLLKCVMFGGRNPRTYQTDCVRISPKNIISLRRIQVCRGIRELFFNQSVSQSGSLWISAARPKNFRNGKFNKIRPSERCQFVAGIA